MPLKRTRVLIADDTDSIRAFFARILDAEGYDVIPAHDGASALAAVREHSPDIVLLDVCMPEPDGIEVCRQLKTDPATRLVPVVLVTGLSELSDRIQGMEAGADDFLSKPVHPHELRARLRSLSRMKRYIDDLDSAAAAFMALALTIEARDPTTQGHCERLARYAGAMGWTLGLGSDDCETLRRGGYLHDIGKVGVPDAVLLKPGRLTPEEFALMQRHAEIGDALCAPLRSLKDARPIVRHHHERLDGSGYPDGLRGDAVPMLAQIVAVADVYDALTSARPYRAPLPRSEAVRELLTDVRAGRLDGHIVEALIAVTEDAAPVSRPYASQDADRSGACLRE